MKLALLTKNRRGRRASPRLSLFPFLAVLICTMGALVLLLLAVTRQARLQALREATAKVAQRQGDMQSEREMTQWRTEQLKRARQVTESQLADARLHLGHIEEHSRRLKDRLAQLQAKCKDLNLADEDTERRRVGTQEELRKLQGEIAAAQQGLTAARTAADKKPRSYAVVPYEGPNQTRRRPIYIECRSDAVVLQPEGITFEEDDFEGPLGPGNPLAAALRAAREYLLAQGGFDVRKDGEPYPLLLVRPSGIAAYYAARAGMKSWASEFGYEMIGDDWPLQFPPPDARLAQIMRQEVDEARVRQRELIAAAPRPYARRSRAATFRVGSSGGIVRDDGGARESISALRAAQESPRYGSRFGAGSGFGGSGTAGGGAPGGSGTGATPDGYGTSEGGVAAGSAGGSGGGTGWSNNFGGGTPASGGSGTGVGTGLPYGAPQDATPGSLAGGGAAVAGGVPGGGGTSPTTGGLAQQGGSPQPGGLASGAPQDGSAPQRGGASGTPVKRPDGYVEGRPFEPPTERPRPPDDQPRESSPVLPRPGEWHPSEEFAPPPKPEKDRDDNRRKKDTKSLAEKRGEDWGLRNAAHGSVPITRPIRVECQPDRLVLMPEPGYGAPKIIPLAESTEGSMDKFIAAVWEHMDSWGIAGKGMYWRPILNVYVVPGAEERFEELSALLRGSGLTVQRKQ